MKINKIHRPDALTYCVNIISQFSENDYLTIEIKKWKPQKTQKQLGLFFLALDYLCKEGGYTESDKEDIRKHIEREYSYREHNILNELVPIPLSKCNRWEQFERYYNGLFALAGELGIDMSDFINQYEQLKAEERGRNNNDGIIQKTD